MNKELVIIIIIVISLILVFYDKIHRYILLKHFFNSYMWIKESASFLIAISGAIRKGKTTLMFALMHLLTLKRRDDLFSKINEIESILIELNFTALKEQYLSLLEIFNGEHNQALKVIIDDLKSSTNEYKYNLDHVLFDGLSKQQLIVYIRKYLYYFNNLIRSHCVFSNVKVFNQITCNYSLEFNSDWLKVKNRDKSKKHDFPLLEYSIFLYDEQLLENSNNSAIQKLNEESGTDIFYRLFGQIFRETSYYLTTLQNVNRWFKSEREIIQQHIYVNDSYFINTSIVKQKIINALESINEFIYNKLSWILNKFNKTDYLDHVNMFKKIKKKIILWNKKNISKSFIKFECSIYSEIESVGKYIDPEKQNPSAYNFNFYIPTCYSWDVGDTHLYHVLYKQLHDNSLLKFTEVRITELLAEDIDNMLTKYKDKNKKDDDF